MKCIACGLEFDGSACPHCGFPVYEVVGSDDSAAAAQIGAFAEMHCGEYLRTMQFGIMLYRWKDQNGEIAEDSCAPTYFASGEALEGGDVWLNEALARIPDEKTVGVRLVAQKGGLNREIAVGVPNLPEAELQQVGLRLGGHLTVRVLLKNASGSAESDPVSIAIG